MTDIFDEKHNSIFSRVEAEWAEDATIDETNLEQTTIKIAKLSNKYLTYQNTAKRLLREREGQLKKLEWLRTEYYLGNLDLDRLRELGWQPCQRKVMKSEVSNFVKFDQLIIDMVTLKAEAADLVEYLDNIIKTISNRGFHIKNIIEYRKFINNAY